jgi:hypothetical protein
MSNNTNNAFTFYPAVLKHDSFTGDRKYLPINIQVNNNFAITNNTIIINNVNSVNNNSSTASSTDVCNNTNGKNNNDNCDNKEYERKASIRDKVFEDFSKKNNNYSNIDAERFIRSGTTTRLSRISHKKSLKIRKIADMMEKKLYNQEDSENETEQIEDEYLAIVLEKPISIKNKKRAKTAFINY